MVTDLQILITMCEEALIEREYRIPYQCKFKDVWEDLTEWMSDNGISEFSEEVGFRYADEKFGNHILSDDFPKSMYVPLRAVRMLTSYQKYGDFEYRSPHVERHFEGESGEIAKEYLKYIQLEQYLAAKTIDQKKIYLHDFSDFLNHENISFSEVTMELVEKFFEVKSYSLSSRHCCGSCLRNFFHYAFEFGYSTTDYSVFILADNYRKNNKLPTTYTEDEIRRMISCVERDSAIGRRDYLVLLLAAEYGWRSGDIISFRFDQIDWDNNVIRFDQEKTGAPVEFPLLASVGNAIIDYLKFGRPVSDAPEVIVSHAHQSLGAPLTSPTVHSIVTRYMKAANISAWNEKRHGAHSLRHSLATNMLKKNVSLPVISTVMGHQNTETTKIYLKVDTVKLAECPLKMPPLDSACYKEVESV